MKVHHIGYAVKDINVAIEKFVNLGYEQTCDVCCDSYRNVKICFVQNGNECVELVAPNGEKTPVDGVLKLNGATPYHICYEVQNIDGAIENLKKQKFIVMQKPAVAPAIQNCKVAFLYNKDIGMIELVEVM